MYKYNYSYKWSAPLPFSRHILYVHVTFYISLMLVIMKNQNEKAIKTDGKPISGRHYPITDSVNWPPISHFFNG